MSNPAPGQPATFAAPRRTRHRSRTKSRNELAVAWASVLSPELGLRPSAGMAWSRDASTYDRARAAGMQMELRWGTGGPPEYVTLESR